MAAPATIVRKVPASKGISSLSYVDYMLATL